MLNTYYVVIRFGLFHSVRRCHVGAVPRWGGEAHGVAVNKMREQYPTAVMTGFFGREEYAKAAAEKANAILLTKI